MTSPENPYAPKKKKKSPVWVIALIGCGCFGGVGFLGIISAILIPNFMDALQKAKQKRTVADIRNVGTASMAWLTDQVGADAAGAAQVSWDISDYPKIDAADLGALLVPDYIAVLPVTDGWEHPMDFRLDTNFGAAAEFMAIRSPGRDGLYSGDVYDQEAFENTDYDEDIVWADGYFIRWPSGTSP